MDLIYAIRMAFRGEVGDVGDYLVEKSLGIVSVYDSGGHVGYINRGGDSIKIMWHYDRRLLEHYGLKLDGLYLSKKEAQQNEMEWT